MKRGSPITSQVPEMSRESTESRRAVVIEKFALGVGEKSCQRTQVYIEDPLHREPEKDRGSCSAATRCRQLRPVLRRAFHPHAKEGELFR
jgi:hypothetical protein